MKILLWPVGMVAALVIGSSLYQAVASRSTLSMHPPPGKLVGVGGHRLHFVVTEGREPTIVLEGGSGMASSFWHFVQGPVAKRTGSRVMSYDRAGLGWSDPDLQPYDIVREVENLHNGLATLGITRDIILVGLSYGGFLAQRYASRYPEQVAGLILVEPNTTAFFTSRPDIVRTIERQAKVRRVLATLGLLRAGLRAGFGEIRVQARGIPELETAVQISLTTRHLHAAQRMLESFGDVLKRMNQGPALPAVPLTVITRGRPENGFPWGDAESEAAWRAGHDQLVRKTPGGRLLVAKKSGHAVIVDEPEVIVEAISNMIERTRHHR